MMLSLLSILNSWHMFCRRVWFIFRFLEKMYSFNSWHVFLKSFYAVENIAEQHYRLPNALELINHNGYLYCFCEKYFGPHEEFENALCPLCRMPTLRELIFANEFFGHFARTNLREGENFKDFARTNFREWGHFKYFARIYFCEWSKFLYLKFFFSR